MLPFVAITIAFWCLIAFGWWSWSRRRSGPDLASVRARLAAGDLTKGKPRQGPALIEREEQVAGKMVARLLLRLRLNERLKALVEQAGLKWNVARTIHASLGLFLGGFAALWYLEPFYRIAAPAVGLILGAMPVMYVLRKRTARLHKFEEQFPEALEFVSRAMRAGHAFSVSLEMIHAEFQEPVAGEFKRTFDEQNLGMPLDLALTKMGERVPLLDVQFFISAVTLQKRTGGNLAEVLDKLASLIRERFKLRGRIRAISAHGKMTGSALTLIPIAVGILMCFVNPGYGQFFAHDDTGKTMLGVAVGLQIIGYGVIQKIVKIEV
ncbi:MAG TPA: type II secretion system F family protein [Bryobacteraceae bacterium]|nr:type II secretion system F family protein [Bryobacteraceae bacterium]